MKKLLFISTMLVLFACGKSGESPYVDFLGAELKDSNFNKTYTVTYQTKTPEGFYLYCEHESNIMPGETTKMGIEYIHAKKKKETILMIKGGEKPAKYYNIKVTTDKITHNEGEIVRIN